MPRGSRHSDNGSAGKEPSEAPCCWDLSSASNARPCQDLRSTRRALRHAISARDSRALCGDGGGQRSWPEAGRCRPTCCRGRQLRGRSYRPVRHQKADVGDGGTFAAGRLLWTRHGSSDALIVASTRKLATKGLAYLSPPPAGYARQGSGASRQPAFAAPLPAGAWRLVIGTNV